MIIAGGLVFDSMCRRVLFIGRRLRSRIFERIRTNGVESVRFLINAEV